MCYNIGMNPYGNLLLGLLTDAAPDGGAVVISKSRMAEALPAGAGDAEVDDALRDLSLTGLVTIKYRSAAEYCIAVTPKGKLLVETERNKITDTAINVRIDYKRMAKTSFWAAFFGALLGSGLIGLAVFLIGHLA